MVGVNMENNKKGLILTLILLIIVILGLVGFILYDKFIKESSCPVCNKCDIKTEDDKLTLEKELSLTDICTNTTGICEKEIVFELGGKKQTIKTYIDMDDVYNDQDESKENYITIDSKKILIGGGRKLDKIAVIGDYLAMGTASAISPNAYKIDVYNNNLELVKTYSSIYIPREIAKDDAQAENYKEYFKIGESAFTRYTCDTSKAYSDGTNQTLVEYLIKIENGEFTETKIAETLEYCSAQFTQ